MIRTLDGQEIYENDIERYIDEFISLQGIESMKKEAQGVWNACLMYVKRNLFTPKQYLPNGQKTLFNLNDGESANWVVDYYIYLCMLYNKEVSTTGFQYLTGINLSNIDDVRVPLFFGRNWKNYKMLSNIEAAQAHKKYGDAAFPDGVYNLQYIPDEENEDNAVLQMEFADQATGEMRDMGQPYNNIYNIKPDSSVIVNNILNTNSLQNSELDQGNRISKNWKEIRKRIQAANEESIRNGLFSSSNITGKIVLANHDLHYNVPGIREPETPDRRITREEMGLPPANKDVFAIEPPKWD